MLLQLQFNFSFNEIGTLEKLPFSLLKALQLVV